MHEARMLICEMYCAINRKVDLTMLADKLQLTDEEAERWMVDMVRGNSASHGFNLNAKIDSSGKQVIISAPARSALKQIVESTRDLTTRSVILCTNLETLAKDQEIYIKNR
jgi:translation initiation factor 3 subunit E